MLAELKKLLPKANFISLIDTTTDVVIKDNISHIGIVASPNTIKSRLHKRLFDELSVLTLDTDGIQRTSQIISSVITRTENQTNNLESQISELIRNGAEKVLLGCTELSVINHTAKFRVVIDPLDIVVESIMENNNGK